MTIQVISKAVEAGVFTDVFLYHATDRTGICHVTASQIRTAKGICLDTHRLLDICNELKLFVSTKVVNLDLNWGKIIHIEKKICGIELIKLIRSSVRSLTGSFTPTLFGL